MNDLHSLGAENFGMRVENEQVRSLPAFARATAEAGGDFAEIPDLLKFIELELFLEKILKRKVDLVDKQALRSELREDILRQVVYV